MVADIDAAFVLSNAPEISYGVEAEEYSTPGTDGRTFGPMRQQGMLIPLELDINGHGSEQVVRAGKETLRRAWRADPVRREAGGSATLISPANRLTFGLPQRFETDDTYMKQGLIRAFVDFAATTDLWFSAEEFSTSLQITQPAYGGVVAPVVAPVITSGSSVRTSSFTVGGELDTYPVIEVQGPVINPAVEVIGVFRFEYRGTLAYDEVLTIDTHPHARTVTVNGAGVALSPTSDRIASASLPPGVHAMTLFGTSQSGTATATVRWRNAFPTY
ncbi:hypothetical protein [Paramicrobacterium agarici]|uniref:hypothetical protein n=1 Tax=Paramicrobacterium agarici TaxID=630514 RepID=UPI00114EB3D5|nr:hypothetical protein [Microbacterium agarici]